MSPGKTPRLFLIDAHGYLHRAHHALPPLTGPKGEPVGALYGFARMLLGLLKKERPEAVGVCFDSPGPTFRHKEYAEYKANRPETDPDLKVQLPRARDLAQSLGLAVVADPGLEADDLIAALARRGEKEGFEVVLVTGDKDALQLVGPHIKVMDSFKGAVLDAAAVEAKLGLPPSQLVDYFTLTGDSIDNVPGAKGIGPVRAVALLKEHGSLDRVLAALESKPEGFTKSIAASLAEFKPRAELTRRLIRLAEDAPMKEGPADCRVAAPGEDAVKLFSELGFHSLLREMFPEGLPGVSAEPGEAARTAAAEPALEALEPADFLKKAAKAPKVALAYVETDGSPALALGLPGGQVCSAEPAALARGLEGAAEKVGHGLKPAIKALKVKGPYFDTALAAYCLNPSRANYRFEDLYQDQLGAPLLLGEGPEGARREAGLIWALADKLEKELAAQGLTKLMRELELPILEVLADMESAGIGVDGAYLLKLSMEFEAGIAGLRREISELAGSELNPGSPKQVAKVLFEDLKLPVLRKTKTGYSTDEETLQSLAGKHPLPAKLLEFREWTKLKGTYIDNLLEQARNGRVHTTFNQVGTATGRLSSVNPNLQNIPIRSALGMKIRKAFVPAKGCVLVSADYSQIDLRLLAHESADPALVAAFQSGEDVHTRTACEVFHKKAGEVNKDDRRIAKAVNFGVVYGQGPHGLAQTLGIPFGEAAGIIKRYFERYAGVKAWIDRQIAESRKSGQARTFMGRVRHLPELSAKNPALRSFGERAAVNTSIQGGSADVIKLAMVAIAKEMGDKFPGARMVLQVHDELVFEAPAKQAGALAVWVKEKMETCASLRVPLVVDLKTGPNWAEMESLHVAV